MEQMTLDTLLAVFEEMFGFWLFWGLVALAVLVTLAFLYVLVRDRGQLAQVPAGATVDAAGRGGGGGVLWITRFGLRHGHHLIVMLGIAAAGPSASRSGPRNRRPPGLGSGQLHLATNILRG
jgi:hypothetical protein